MFLLDSLSRVIPPSLAVVVNGKLTLVLVSRRCQRCDADGFHANPEMANHLSWPSLSSDRPLYGRKLMRMPGELRPQYHTPLMLTV